jgi:hypothetical protein
MAPPTAKRGLDSGNNDTEQTAASGRGIETDLPLGQNPHCNFKISPSGDWECTPFRFKQKFPAQLHRVKGCVRIEYTTFFNETTDK